MDSIGSLNYSNSSSLVSTFPAEDLYAHLLSDDGVDLDHEAIIRYLAQDFVNSSSREEAAAKYSELKSMRDFTRFQRDVALNAMLTSATVDTIRHAEIYQDSSAAYLSLDNLISDLEGVLRSK